MRRSASLQLAAHTTRPDVIRQLPIIYRPELIANGYVEDLQPFAQKSNWDVGSYYSGPFEGYRIGNHLWGVPTGIYTMALYYNKTMFKEASIPLPSTDWEKGYDWDQFLSVAQKLTKGRGPGKVYGFSTDTDLRWWINFIWQAGGDFLTPGYKQSALSTPAAQEALNFIHDLIFKYEVWPNPVAFNNPGNLFVSGKLAMTIDGNWQIPLYKTIKNFEWGVMPMPHNTKTYTGYYIDGWFVPPKGVARPDLSLGIDRVHRRSAGRGLGSTAVRPGHPDPPVRRDKEPKDSVQSAEQGGTAGLARLDQVRPYLPLQPDLQST